MHTLSGIVIASNPDVRAEAISVLSSIPSFRLLNPANSDSMSYEELEGIVRLFAPKVIFVDTSDVSRTIAMLAELNRTGAPAEPVVLCSYPEGDAIVQAMRLGAREFLTLPLRAAEVKECLERIRRASNAQTIGVGMPRRTYAFLPAKPGVGATTVCLNTAVALAKRSGERVGVLDFDLNCGTIDFLLNLEAGFSVRDVAEHAPHLDSVIWERHVSRLGSLDVLRAGHSQPERTVDDTRLEALALFARQHYTEVCVDLPAIGEPGSLAGLHAATQIFLVTTPELPSLYMAKRAIEMLNDRGLRKRMSLILNRVDSHSPMNRQQVEEFLDCEVTAVFPNYWMQIQRALVHGSAVPANGALASRFAGFAKLLHQPPTPDFADGGILGYLGRMFTGHRSARV